MRMSMNASSSRSGGGGGLQQFAHQLTDKISSDSISGNTTCFSTMVVHTRGVWFGEDPLSYSFDLLLFELPIISIATTAMYLILKPLGHPIIIPQILGGLLLGPSFLGHNKAFMNTVFPIRGKVLLETLSLLGFIYFQFLIGVRMDPSMIFESGKRTIAIGVLGFFFPIFFGAVASIMLRKYTKMETHVSKALKMVVSAQSMSSFPVISCFLSDLKILNSEIGRLAASSSMISDLCSVILLSILRITFMITGENGGFQSSIRILTSTGILIAIALVLVRPAAFWVIRRTPEGKPVKEIYLFGFIVMVLVSTVISQVTGQGYILVPLMMGLVIPDGPPLGSALEERIDLFVSVLLMPIFYTLCGLKTDLFKLDGTLWSVQVVNFTCFVAKTIGVILPNLYCRMPLRDSFILALIMNSKGIVELSLYNSWLEDQMLSRNMFTVMIMSVLITTACVSRLVQCLYNPSRRYLPYRRRTIQHTKGNTELGILVCVHSQENVPNMIQLLDISNPNKENSVHVCVLHMVELVGRATSLLITHHRNGVSKPAAAAASKLTQSSEHIIKAFRYFEQIKQGHVWVDIITSVCPSLTMHDDVCALALEKRASLIILPFHKQWVAEGAIESSAAIQNLNCNALERSPCSVGILVNHHNRFLSSSQTLLGTREELFCVALLFFGGADDREALSYSARIAQHPNVRLTALRFTSKGNLYNDERMRILDNDTLTWFKNETIDNDRVWFKEEIVSDGTSVLSVVRSIEKTGYDLVIVGRRHMESPLMSGLTEWTEHPELGIIGDLLAASDFKSLPCVLVVQQQLRVWGKHSLDNSSS